MPKRFKMVCIPCKALYQCSAFTFAAHIYFILVHMKPHINIKAETHGVRFEDYIIWNVCILNVCLSSDVVCEASIHDRLS